MKHILIYIFLSLVFLTGSTNMDETSQKHERVGMETVLQEVVPTEYRPSSVAEFPDRSEAYVDSESLARQFRICGRGQRSFSVQYILLNKGSAYRLVNKRLELLFHSIHHIYTSLPHPSWAVPSDHYVFGLRHILI